MAWGTSGCRLKGVLQGYLHPRNIPLLIYLPLCVLEGRLAEAKGPEPGNGGCVCGKRLSSGREEEAEVLRS